tara:strand:- start:233 stop:655 length:423 start_codon:yes stop_codon:yes gene_type:complete
VKISKKIMLIKSSRELRELISKLKSSCVDAVVVVEGESDKQALQALGVEADYFLLQKQKFATGSFTKSGALECAEKIANRSKRAILMLDYDRAGKKLTSVMKTALQRQGAHVDTSLGRLILTKANVSHVEGLRKLANLIS